MTDVLAIIAQTVCTIGRASICNFLAINGNLINGEENLAVCQRVTRAFRSEGVSIDVRLENQALDRACTIAILNLIGNLIGAIASNDCRSLTCIGHIPIAIRTCLTCQPYIAHRFTRRCRLCCRCGRCCFCRLCCRLSRCCFCLLCCGFCCGSLCRLCYRLSRCCLRRLCCGFCCRCRCGCCGSRCCCSGSRCCFCCCCLTAATIEVVSRVNFRERTNLCRQCRRIAAECCIHTGNCYCKASIIVQSHFRLCIGVNRVCNRTACIRCTANQCANQGILCLSLIRVCSSVVDTGRILIAVAQQIAIASRVIAQDEVHLILCSIQISIVVCQFAISQRICLPCAVITGVAPAINDIILLCIIAGELIGVELYFIQIRGVASNSCHQTSITAPNFTPAVNPAVVIGAIIAAIAGRLCSRQRILAAVSQIHPSLSPSLIARNVIRRCAIHITHTRCFIAAVLLAEVVNCISILHAFSCICCIAVLCYISSCCQSRCHLIADTIVVIGRCQPVSRTVISLKFRRTPCYIVVTAVADSVADCCNLAAVIKICSFHEIACSLLHNFHEVCFCASLLECFRISVVSPAHRGCIECHGEVKLYMVACIMITAGNICCTIIAICSLNDGFCSTGQTGGIAQSSFSVISMAVASPCQTIVVYFCTALICIVEIQRQTQCLSIVFISRICDDGCA